VADKLGDLRKAGDRILNPNAPSYNPQTRSFPKAAPPPAPKPQPKIEVDVKISQ
jgi:hypothetical protein